MTLQDLLEIEMIRALRTRYAHLDSLDLDALAALFTDEAVCDFGPHGAWRGRPEIRRRRPVDDMISWLTRVTYPLWTAS